MVNKKEKVRKEGIIHSKFNNIHYKLNNNIPDIMYV